MESTTCGQARRVKKTALKLVKKLDEASTAMNEFIRACRDAGYSEIRGVDDSRLLLIERMQEYGFYLDSVHNKP